MTEIRAIRPDETETFLRLLCDVFALDFARAYDVFHTEPFFDLERKWALFEGREMVSILTTTPLLCGWGRAVGIAGVATLPDRQGEGYATMLLQRVLKESERRGEGPALLFAKETKLYEKNGFEPIDRVVRARVQLCPDIEEEILPTESVVEMYDRWAEQHPDRLRRDEQRWRYWRWHYRVATPFADGYICHEPGALRECLFTPKISELPLPPETEYLGTTFMADQLELPLGPPTVDLYLMGHNIPGIPQMFMTDQF